MTWDVVNCPGISIAEKWKSPSLESLAVNDIDSRLITRGEIERSMKTSKLAGVAQESAAMNVHELFASLGWSEAVKGQPAFMKW